MATLQKTSRTHFKTLLQTLPKPPFSLSYSPFSSSSSSSSSTKPELPTHEPNPEADMIANIIITHHNPYHAMESSLQLHGISLSSSSLLHQTLLRLSHLSKLALSFFSYTLSTPSSAAAVDAAAYNILVDILGKVRQFDVAWQLILSMSSETLNLKPQNSIFLILIRRQIAAGLTRQAIRVFEDMSGFTEVEPSGGDCVYVMDTLCKYGHVRVGMDLFSKWKKLGVELGVKGYTVMMAGWCKIKRVDMAERLLREMEESKIEANVVCYNVLLDGICRKSSLHPEEMVESGVTPSAVTYNCFFKELRGRKDGEKALELYRRMRKEGLCVPSLHTCNILVQMFVKMNRMEVVEELWNDMRESGVGPDLDSYTVLVHGLSVYLMVKFLEELALISG